MNKTAKFYIVTVFAVIAGLFTSCTDYQDEIDALDARVKKLEEMASTMQKNLDNLADIGRMKGAPAVQAAQDKASAGNDDYEARKEQERRKRKVQKKIDDCEKEVERISKEIKDIEEWLSTPTGAQNPAMFEAYGKLKNDLAEAEKRWEEAMIEGESL
jgi:ATP-binding cassette subfamily F protein 3